MCNFTSVLVGYLIVSFHFCFFAFMLFFSFGLSFGNPARSLLIRPENRAKRELFVRRNDPHAAVGEVGTKRRLSPADRLITLHVSVWILSFCLLPLKPVFLQNKSPYLSPLLEQSIFTHGLLIKYLLQLSVTFLGLGL